MGADVSGGTVGQGGGIRAPNTVFENADSVSSYVDLKRRRVLDAGRFSRRRAPRDGTRQVALGSDALRGRKTGNPTFLQIRNQCRILARAMSANPTCPTLSSPCVLIVLPV